MIHSKEVSHELEFFNMTGYASALRWMAAFEFVQNFNRLSREALGLIPTSDEKIVLGSWENYEQMIKAARPDLSKTYLKLKGGWTAGGNFAGQFSFAEDSTSEFNLKRGFAWEFTPPSFSELLASALTNATGVDFLYNQRSKSQVNASLEFSPDMAFGLKMKWYNFETRSVKTGETMSYVSNPVTTEIFSRNHCTAGSCLHLQPFLLSIHQ
ncbi:MAG: hypothetical protein K0B09_09050 [Bacteroidales bacterium]|nr:hypothetical protein [Bacteroidales bacterium]